MSDGRVERALRAYLGEMQRTSVSVSSVTEPEEAWDVHVRDSLSGLEIEALRSARLIADIGSGGGFPGVALAAASESSEVDLIESVRRKCEFMREALAAAGIANARVIEMRAEEWAAAAGRERYEAVAVRAVGRLAELAELASPLLSQGGSLIAWKGDRDPDEEEELSSVCEAAGMALVEVRPVSPYRGSRSRHLYLLEKVGPTPDALPRRPGMARKRPFRG